MHIRLRALTRWGKAMLARWRARAPAAGPPAAPTPQGSLDVCEPDRIAGWVRLAGAPPLTLELRHGAVCLGTTLANLHRADLLAAGLRDGNHGFRFQPTGLAARDMPGLTITIGDTGMLFASDARAPTLRERHPSGVYRRDGARPFATGILHIGTEKTGTSTLQTFLWRNRAAFARHGLFLPLALTPHAGAEIMNHEYLPILAAEEADAELWALRAQKFAELDREVAGAPQCTRLLLSSEHCHSRIVTPRGIAHVRALLDPFCENLEIHVYLRPQHELAMSRYGMALMLGVADGNPLPRMPAGPPTGQALYFDYQALLARWAAVFGAAAIHPHILERGALIGGSVTSDFVDAIGLDMTDFDPTPDIGGNVSPAAQRFLARLYATPHGQALPTETRVWISERLREIAPGSGPKPTRGEARYFLDQFADSNEAVRQRWFRERPTLFTVDLSRLPLDVEPVAPDEALERRFGDILHAARMRQPMARAATTPELRQYSS